MTASENVLSAAVQAAALVVWIRPQSDPDRAAAAQTVKDWVASRYGDLCPNNPERAAFWVLSLRFN